MQCTQSPQKDDCCKVTLFTVHGMENTHSCAVERLLLASISQMFNVGRFKETQNQSSYIHTNGWVEEKNR